jgi:NAD-dependent histone deacetylase SIR2
MKTIGDEFLKNNKDLFEHRKCVFIVGAGISVASGIPDFRSPTGIFASLRQQLKINGKQLFTYSFGIKEESRKTYLKYISSLKKLCDSAIPNITHHFLMNFPRSRVYTQNIDGLEERAGMIFEKKDKTKGIYLHGNMAYLICQYCGFRRKFLEEDIIDFEEENEILCSECEKRREASIRMGQRKRPVGMMHPGIIHYQQMNPDGAFIGKMCEKDADSDLVIVIGTSLSVEGVKKVVKMFCKNQVSSGKRILVNLTKPNKEWMDYFDYFYEGDCGDFARTVEKLVKMPRYKEECINYKDIEDNDDKEEVNIDVNIGTKLKRMSIREEDSDINSTNKEDSDISSTNKEDSDINSTNKEDSDINSTDKEDSNINSTDKEDSDGSINSNSRTNKDKGNLNKSNKEFKGEFNSRSIELKLEQLSQVFSDEETIIRPVLNDLIKNSISIETAELPCDDIQLDISNLIKKKEEIGNESLLLTPVKKKSKV